MDPAKRADQLRKLALAYPETYEESPWGDRVVKVKGKIFLFCGEHEGQLGLSLKLPSSGREVLREKWAKPTAYGLGKAGWVSCTIGKGDAVSDARIAAFIDESYRAVAPKKLVALLAGDEKPVAKTARAHSKKLKHRVLLLCEDRLRIARAVNALSEEGVAVESVASASLVRARLKKLDAVIIDVGRSQNDGLELAAEIDASDHPIHLFIVGIRDAAARKRAEHAATSAELFRAPPGDSAVAAAIAATLAKY